MGDWSDVGGPLLFSVNPTQDGGPAQFSTPSRPTHMHSPLRDSGTMSSRRSATPTGSVHRDNTPSRPPIARLEDMQMTDADPIPSPVPAAPEQPAAATAAQAGSSGGMLRAAEQQSQAEDTWVTVYGFTPDDLPLVLREFQRCGDILQWGTFGASPQSNFMHVQYQNKFGAQRALQRSGEQLSSSLIIGVKQLEQRHRALVQAWTTGGDGSPGPRVRPATGPVRPYKVEVPQAQVLPQRSHTWMQKVEEYVLGL